MDLYSVGTYLCPKQLDEVTEWQSGQAWLAGGTWMFSEPQPQVQTLIDITQLGWSELEVTAAGLTIGATCTLGDLLHGSYPASWTGVKALQSAVHELASFKVQNVATVGGNLCLAIPAGTFAPAMVLLKATYEILPLHGSPYSIPAAAFQTGVKQTVLQPGDLLRRISITTENLQWLVNYKRICVSSAGLAISIVATAYHPQTNQVRCAIGAALPAPQLLEFDHVPATAELVEALDSQISPDRYLEDSLASAAYRRHVTQVLMERSLQELVQP